MSLPFEFGVGSLFLLSRRHIRKLTWILGSANKGEIFWFYKRKDLRDENELVSFEIAHLVNRPTSVKEQHTAAFLSFPMESSRTFSWMMSCYCFASPHRGPRADPTSDGTHIPTQRGQRPMKPLCSSPNGQPLIFIIDYLICIN